MVCQVESETRERAEEQKHRDGVYGLIKPVQLHLTFSVTLVSGVQRSDETFM